MGATAVEVYNNTGRKDIISGVRYNEFGQMTQVTRGNGTETHYTYDIKGRLSNLVTFTVTNNETRKLQDVSYTFKTDNSIKSTINTPDLDTAGGYLSTVRYDYKYDGLNRLVNAQGLYTKGSVPNSGTQDIVKRFETGFEYEQNGNMSKKNICDPVSHGITESLVYTYGNANHAVTSISSYATAEERYHMTYDANGNMTGQRITPAPQTPLEGGLTAKTMEYDSYNRIRRVTNSDTSEVVGQYWYDDQGFRVRKLAKRRVSGEDRQVEVLYPSMYFGLEKHRTTSGTEIPNTTYAVNNIYLDGVRIAAVIPSGDARYYLTDQVDSVKVVADDNGLPVSRMEYMPYGETWFEEGDTNNAPKYNSQELDKESNFYYYNARHYSQDIARFVTPDTVIDGEMDTQGWNRYAYCKNNPIMYKDPTGHDSIISITNEVEQTRKDNGKEFNTYKGYIYKDSWWASAETKYKVDKFFGKKVLAEKDVLEVTRKTEVSDMIGSGRNGTMPPTESKTNIIGAEKYIVKKGDVNGIKKYRIGEEKDFGNETNETKVAQKAVILDDKSLTKRKNFNFDPYNKPSELKGCLGITNPDRPIHDYDQANWGSGEKQKFNKLNNYLETLIPDLKDVNKTKKEGGQTVSVYVEDLRDGKK